MIRDYFEQIHCPEQQNFSVIIEIEEPVAYAYLLDGEEIISDVWLYNLNENASPDWEDPEKLPFEHAQQYIVSFDKTILIDELSDDSVEWIFDEQSVLKLVKLFKRNLCVATLAPHKFPGCSINALVNTRLAFTLKDDI